MQVGLRHDGTVPLAYWRLEMWSMEGRIIKTAEGRELPVKFGVELQEADERGEIQGFVFMEDVLGNKSRQKVEDLFLLARTPEPKEDKTKKPAPFSESWVDEF